MHPDPRGFLDFMHNSLRCDEYGTREYEVSVADLPPTNTSYGHGTCIYGPRIGSPMPQATLSDLGRELHRDSGAFAGQMCGLNPDVYSRVMGQTYRSDRDVEPGSESFLSRPVVIRSFRSGGHSSQPPFLCAPISPDAQPTPPAPSLGPGEVASFTWSSTRHSDTMATALGH